MNMSKKELYSKLSEILCTKSAYQALLRYMYWFITEIYHWPICRPEEYMYMYCKRTKLIPNCTSCKCTKFGLFSKLIWMLCGKLNYKCLFRAVADMGGCPSSFFSDQILKSWFICKVQDCVFSKYWINSSTFRHTIHHILVQFLDQLDKICMDIMALLLFCIFKDISYAHRNAIVCFVPPDF